MERPDVLTPTLPHSHTLAPPHLLTPAILAGTFLVALAGVALEVALVRVFALLFRYHHLFLLVSVAVCGLGLGGLLRTYLPDRCCRLWTSALLFGLSIPAVLLLLFRSPLAARLVETPWLPLVPMVPFLFAGLFLSEAFRRHAAQGGALYAADLTGAALAALLVVPLLERLGGFGTCFLVAALACGGAAVVAGDARRGARAACALAALACLVLLTGNRSLRLVDLPPLPPEADPALTKPMLKELQPGSPAKIVATRWSAFARTDVTDEGSPEVRYVYTDGDTPTNMIRFDGDLKKVAELTGQLGFLPYRLARAQSVLAIGPGGGLDVLLGLLGGAQRIVGAEVNAEIVGLMDEFRDFNGDLYRRPGVLVRVADGRAFTARETDRYDLIYSALTQSATGSRAGIALAESYIHTREAFAVYLDRLSERGMYALVVQEERALVRAFLTAVSVLAARGESVPEACRHLVAAVIPEEARAYTPYRRILIFRRAPFAPEDAEQALEAIKGMRAHPVFVPHVLESIPPFAPLASGSQSVARFAAGYTYSSGYGDAPFHSNVAPSTDDRPFFLDFSPTLPVPLRRLLWGVGLAAGLSGVWLGIRRRGAPSGSLRGLGAALFFALLGAGFMLLEVPLIQQFILFLEHPVRSMSLVLFALLLGTAAGSRCSQRWPAASLPARVAIAALAAVLLALLYRAALPGFCQALLRESLLLREVATLLLCLPLGFALGVPFPSGIRWAERDDVAQVPWLWGMNGLASVLGSALAMVLAWRTGFSAALLAGAAAYTLAAALALAARAAQAATPAAPAPGADASEPQRPPVAGAPAGG
ncbi:MAG: hypothetical protein HY321_17595 [Armatimonadetes bacterium]|nr:hypothetical protein [Armatimonadota bacterium]